MGFRQTPQRRVHALLGSLPAYQNDCEKRNHRQHAQLLHTTYFLAMAETELAKVLSDKSDNQPKRFLQKRILPIKTTNDQNANFEETDFDQKPTKPTKPR